MECRSTKTGKPMAQCDTCRAQLFIRGREGAELFSKRYGTAWKGVQADGAPKPDPKPAPAPRPATAKSGWDLSDGLQ